MESASEQFIFLEYQPGRRGPTLTSWGIAGCWLMSALLGALFVLCAAKAVQFLLLFEYRKSALFLGALPVAVWGSTIFARAANDLAEDFRCHVMQAVYYLLLLIGSLIGIGSILLAQVSDAEVRSGAAWWIAAGFFSPVFFLVILLWLLVTIARRWRVRNRVGMVSA